MKTSGISWHTKNGSQVPTAKGSTTTGSQRAPIPGSSASHTRRIVHTANTACIATTGQTLCIVCSGSMNTE